MNDCNISGESVYIKAAVNSYNFKDRLCNLFNTMRIDRPAYSSEVSPINFDGGSFYYTERDMSATGRSLSIINSDGMSMSVTMPYTGFRLEYSAKYLTYNLPFEEACFEYGLDKANSLLAQVEKKIDELKRYSSVPSQDEVTLKKKI